jgi:hypothetical protein
MHSNMIRSTENQREKRVRPFCQATGCFDHADVYLVLKETEIPDYYEAKAENAYEKTRGEVLDFDGFKLILYLCSRHDDEFKYLIKGSELWVSKRQHLCCPEIR